MKEPIKKVEPAPKPSRLSISAFVLAFIGLFAFQAWMTLGLFSVDRSYEAIIDDRPLLSGHHPEHLYLGTVGAQSLWRSGHSCCFDPAFQAGYPKTPVFNGSRLAELAVFVCGGEYNPAAYKIEIAVVCMIVPLLLFMAARGVGLNAGGVLLSVVLGMLVWWGNPCQTALRVGDIDLLLASLAVLSYTGLLVRFDRNPGVFIWLGMVLTCSLAWFAQPLVVPLMAPLFLVYYLTVGARHATLTWHFALWGTQFLGVAVNLGWLIDWVEFWWVRSPISPGIEDLLPHRTIRSVWNAPLWGGAVDRASAVALLAGALIGVGVWHVTQRRPAARLMGLGAGGLLVAAVFGVTLRSFGEWQTSRLVTASLWFAALPTACALIWICTMLRRVAGSRTRFAMIVAMVCTTAGVFGASFFHVWRDRIFVPQPMTIGLSSIQRSQVDVVAGMTNSKARILWETKHEDPNSPRWTALLPMMTHRYFVGGLDPNRTIAHSTVGFADGELAGKKIQLWTNDALADYCRRYNIGWIACWTESAVDRLKSWHGASSIAELPGRNTGFLFRIQLGQPNYALRGQANMVYADCHRITFSDVVPQDGAVVLSMHYQSGLRALPSRVQVEREPDAEDPIGFIRLRVARPVASVTLTWDEP